MQGGREAERKGDSEERGERREEREKRREREKERERAPGMTAGKEGRKVSKEGADRRAAARQAEDRTAAQGREREHSQNLRSMISSTDSALNPKTPSSSTTTSANISRASSTACLLYTSDAADDM
eukprot:3522581-Rhodomonas_salina.1